MRNAHSAIGMGYTLDFPPKRESTPFAPIGCDAGRKTWSLEDLSEDELAIPPSQMPDGFIFRQSFDELAEKVEALLSPLPELNRNIMIARHVENLGWKAIAERFEMSIGQVKAEEKYGRLMLKNTLGEGKNVVTADNSQIH